MLKLTYTENSFDLDYLTQPLEEWLTTRVLLALRSQTSLSLEPSTAAFLLPADAPYVEDLIKAASTNSGEIVEVSLGDENLLEVVLQGTWLVSNSEAEEGLFVCHLSDHIEFFLYQIWQATQLSKSMIDQ